MYCKLDAPQSRLIGVAVRVRRHRINDYSERLWHSDTSEASRRPMIMQQIDEDIVYSKFTKLLIRVAVTKTVVSFSPQRLVRLN